jgi:hypothetical protein
MQQPADDQDPAARYLHLLVEGRAADALALFADEPSIDDPLHGQAAGSAAASSLADAAVAWLRERDALVKLLRTTRGPDRSVVEALLDLAVGDGRVVLPIALVAERSAEGRLAQVRVYHSTWPLSGSHRVRRPLLPRRDDLALPDVVERYQEALATGSLEAVLAVFEPDGYAREPSGGSHVYRGEAGLRAFYSGLFSVGGIPLDHCSVTDDGICCAIEYNVVQWGGAPITPQAGVAVYERGPSGLLAAARIYDDVAIEEGGQT